MKLAKGITRLVLLAGPWAIKLPRPQSWRQFLMGLLANLHERLWWNASGGDRRLCPVLFADPLGFVVVMQRVSPLRQAEWDALPDSPAAAGFDGLPSGDWKLPNLGRLPDGRVVLIDYGS